MIVSAYEQNGKFYELIVWPIIDNNNEVSGFIHVVRDITEKKRSEELLKKSLQEKDILLKELFHRTRNNMNVIASFIHLEKLKSGDKRLNNIFDDLVSRIYTMALVHQKLYQSKNLSRIELDEYIKDLVKMIFNNYNTYNIKVNFSLEKLTVLLDIAVPFGLVINEIISNSIKHAFPDRKDGIITIDLKNVDEKKIFLSISDNGVGIENDFDINQSDSLGIVTIRDIIRNQLQGNIEIINKDGLLYNITINTTLYNERI